MRTDIVLTLTGNDRVGIVEEVTRALLALDGNVESSRMARLGGEFAILALVSLPVEHVVKVEPALADFVAAGYKLSVSETGTAASGEHAGWVPYEIEVTGADHEGIIHDVAERLSRLGINIESAETSTVAAPVTGVPLFTMTAQVAVPREVAETDWVAAVAAAGEEENVDIDVIAL